MARVIDGVIGHRSTWERLRSAVAHDHLPHAMAFTGPAGIGKRLVARALAQTLLCEAEPVLRPCGTCGACRRVEAGSHEALLMIEPEKNQIKLDSAHAILEFLSLRRLTRARVVVVNEVQLMNAQTANACLKVIEEPPPATFFILITPEISQLLPTLRSRSQVVRFAPLNAEELARAAVGTAPPDAWMIEASRGSVARLNDLREPDVVALRDVALTFLKDAAEGRRAGLTTVLASVKDRERTLTTIQFLQQLLRDWSVGALELKDLSAFARVGLWQLAHRMEVDFNAHVDRNLIFENFFNRVTRDAAGRAG